MIEVLEVMMVLQVVPVSVVMLVQTVKEVYPVFKAWKEKKDQLVNILSSKLLVAIKFLPKLQEKSQLKMFLYILKIKFR